MGKHKILIAGLPDTGKSTFIGALWALVNHYAEKVHLSMVASDTNVPDLIDKLDELSQAWMKVSYIPRSSKDIAENMQIELVASDDKSKMVTLDFPDFMGESFRKVISQNHPKEIDSWCENADSLLFFIGDFSCGAFYDDIKGFEEGKDEDKSKFNQKDLRPDLMTPAAQNMLILRYLKEHSHFKHVTICITQWDKYVKVHAKSPRFKSPEEFLGKNSPALYNFIKYHFSDVRFYGLSSQGDEYQYEKQTDEQVKKDIRIVKQNCKDKLKQLTKEGQRAFLCWGKTMSYDITLLISEIVN